MSITVKKKVHFNTTARGAKRVVEGPPPHRPVAGRIPRITRLMALAVRFDELIREGKVSDYAELARIGHVSRARITQIMNLLNLAPDIQEAILDLPRVESGKDPVADRQVRQIVAEADWGRQRKRFHKRTHHTHAIHDSMNA